MVKNVKLTLFIISICLILLSCDSPKVIPFTLTNTNRIILEADVNGTKGKYFWDTGSFLSQVDCRVDNLKFSSSSSFAQNHTSSNLTYYLLDGITINGVWVNAKSEVSNIPDSLRSDILTPENIDGVLGINIFDGYWCELSFSDQKIYLHSKKPNKIFNSIPAEFENNYILISGTIDGDPTRFYIDTGSPNIMMFPESIIRKKSKTDYSKIETNNSQNIFLVNTSDISIFDTHIKNVYVMTDTIFNQITLSGGTGLIGMGLLKNYNLLFDFTQLKYMKISKVYYNSIQNNINWNNYFITQVPTTGVLQVINESTGIRIVYILKNSSLYNFGVRPNYLLTKINGEPYTIGKEDHFISSIYYPKNDLFFTFEYNGKEINIPLSVN